MLNANLLAVVYALGLFLWGAISEGSYPSKRFVDYLGYYAVAVLVIKYAARIASKLLTFKDTGQRAFVDDVGITMRSSCDGLAKQSCSAPDQNLGLGCNWIDDACIQLPSFQTDLLPDALLILSIFVHRVGQTRLGMWAPHGDGDDDENTDGGNDDGGDENNDYAGEGAGGGGRANNLLLAEAESSLVDNRQQQDQDAGGASAGGASAGGATASAGAEANDDDDDDDDDDDAMVRPSTTATISRIGTDYYTASFAIQSLALVVSILGYGPGFSTVQEQSVSPSAIVLENVVPVAFVLYLVFQLLLIIIDRVLYMLHSNRLKRYFHVVIVILIHVLVFIVLPRQTKKPFDKNKVVQLWYLIQCFYLFVSAAQVKAGYQSKGARDIAEQQQQQSKMLKARLLQAKIRTVVYYNIPFLYEARSVLDWACTTTALSLTQYLKMEGIRKDLIQTHLNRLAEEKDGRSIGTKQGRCAKCIGILIFFVVICVILFPLILMSVAQQNSKPLPPIRAELSLQLATFEPLYVMDDIPKQINETAYQWLEGEQYTLPGLTQDNVHVTTLGDDSKSVWPISPTSRDSMVNALQRALNPADLKLRMAARWTFNRDVAEELASTVAQETHGSMQRELNVTEIDSMLKAMSNSSVVVPLPDLVPAFIHLGSGSSTNALRQTLPLNAIKEYISCSLQRTELPGDSRVEWWEVRMTGPPQWARERSDTSTQIEIVTFSDKVIQPTYTFLTNYGIVGLYVSIVLVVGKFMRMLVTDLSTRIRVEDMPNVEALRNLCMAICTSRSLQPPDLVLEEELYHMLISIYRRDDALFAWTSLKPE